MKETNKRPSPIPNKLKPKHKNKNVENFGFKFNGLSELQETLGIFFIVKNIFFYYYLYFRELKSNEMRKYFFIIIILFLGSKALSHADHYKNISKIEMDVIRNGEKIGFSNYYFKHTGNVMEVKNNTEFEVKLFGIVIFSISSQAIEIYEKDELVFFKSNTLQNDKKKYANLEFNKNTNKFFINGSSFKGEADKNNVIGNWWNSKILSANSQISPLSGSVKEQIVSLLKKETIVIKGKSYETLHFKLKSKDENLPDDKKLNFDIWLDPKKGFIVKVSYERLGKWEYILKKVE